MCLLFRSDCMTGKWSQYVYVDSVNYSVHDDLRMYITGIFCSMSLQMLNRIDKLNLKKNLKIDSLSERHFVKELGYCRTLLFWFFQSYF